MVLEALRDLIVKRQKKDGSWVPGGRLPALKRPFSETTQVSTMLCLLGLATIPEPSEGLIKGRDLALAWLDKTPPNGKDPAVSGEWYTMRLLVDKRLAGGKQVDALRDKILAAQRPDGGWGWLWSDPSDAFGTGLALYALAESGLPSTDPAVERAWKFLIETQTDAGSWLVNGTKKDTKDKPHPFSSFWGSTWALLGLSKTLPDSAMTAAAAKTPSVVAHSTAAKP